MANTYLADNYTDWKKKWGTEAGNRTDGMTDYDYELGLYLKGLENQKAAADATRNDTVSALEQNYAQSKANVGLNYNLAVANLDAERQTSEQNADILHQKMAKYLKTQADAAGLNNTGYASPESLALRANANYSQNLGNIAANYNTNKTALDQQKMSSMSELESAYATGKANAQSNYNKTLAELDAGKTAQLLSLYDAERTEDKQNATIKLAEEKAAAQETMNKYLSALESANDEAQAKLVYTMAKGNVSDENLDYLNMLINSKVTALREDAATKKKAADNEATAAQAEKDQQELQYFQTQLNYGSFKTTQEAVDYINANANMSESAKAAALGIAKGIDNNNAIVAGNDAANASSNALQNFQVLFSNGVYGTTAEALAAIDGMNMTAQDKAMAQAIATLVDKNNQTTAKDEATAAQTAAYNNVAQMMQYTSDADTVWAAYDQYADQMSDSQRALAEANIIENYGERNAVTLDKFKNGAAYNGFTYVRSAGDAMAKDGSDLAVAVNKKYGATLTDTKLKDGDYVEINNGTKKNPDNVTYMYYKGEWFEVKKKKSGLSNYTRYAGQNSTLGKNPLDLYK